MIRDNIKFARALINILFALFVSSLFNILFNHNWIFVGLNCNILFFSLVIGTYELKENNK